MHCAAMNITYYVFRFLPKSSHQLARVDLAALAAAELLHHALHLLELADQRRDILKLGAAAFRDTLLAPALDDVGVAPLLPGHREDDRLDPLHILLAHQLLVASELAHAGD